MKAGEVLAPHCRLAAADALLARSEFPPPDSGPVYLAVSGGPDSLALLVLAAHAGLGGVVIHVDHGLRANSGSEADVVAEAAAIYHFDFERRVVQVEPGPNLEARARRARYEALPLGVLTGHTMDDQAETVLLNVLRGAALDGLAGMRRSRAAVRRPLLNVRRSETAALCGQAGLVPIADPTNLDRRFRRNRVRLDVLPLLCDVAGRDLVPVLARQADLLAADADLLDEMAAALDPSDAKSLRQSPEALARRAVRGWLRSVDLDERHPPSSAETARVLAVAAGVATACELSGGRRVQRRAGRLRIVSPNDPRE